MNIQQHLDDLIAQHGVRHWTRFALKDDAFVSAINDTTLGIDNLTFPERVLAALHGDPTCPNGSRKKYRSITTPWVYCGRVAQCACARESVSQKCKTNIDHAARLAKTTATLLERYGVSNPGQTPVALANHKAFYQDEELVRHAVEKGRQTILERDSYAGRRIAGEERRAVKLAEYNKEINLWRDNIVPNDMIACQICNKAMAIMTSAHCRLHDLTTQQYQNRFPNALFSNSEVSQKRSLAAKGRIASPHSKQLIQRSKLGFARGGNGVSRISKEAHAILNDDDVLRNMFLTMPIRSIAHTLGVSATYLAARSNELGIKRYSSSLERSVANMVSEWAEPVLRTKKIISPKEIDIYVPNHNLAIEICGLYYHNNRTKHSGYHQEKMQECHKRDIRLLTIFEDEIYKKPEIIRSRIRNILGYSPKGVGGRKSKVTSIDRTIANDFLESHHIQGGSQNNKYSYGAYDGDQLVAVMSFKPSWRNHGIMELARFATDDCTHAGIASKLFKAFVRDHNPDQVITYADRRWSEGDLYLNMGFSCVGKIQRSYTYWRSGSYDRLDKTQFRLDRIQHLVPDNHNKTESEIMHELGYWRIYDCGYLKFKWTS